MGGSKVAKILSTAISEDNACVESGVDIELMLLEQLPRGTL